MKHIYLVVDESAAEAVATERLLRQVNPRGDVWLAGSTAEALELIESRRTVPSLTFIEGNIAGGGIELLSAIRRARWLEKAPVAMLSRPVSDRVVVTCYRLGACAFLTKPVRPHELRETVRDHARAAFAMSAGTLVAGSHFDGERNAA